MALPAALRGLLTDYNSEVDEDLQDTIMSFRSQGMIHKFEGSYVALVYARLLGRCSVRNPTLQSKVDLFYRRLKEEWESYQAVPRRIPTTVEIAQLQYDTALVIDTLVNQRRGSLDIDSVIDRLEPFIQDDNTASYAFLLDYLLAAGVYATLSRELAKESIDELDEQFANAMASRMIPETTELVQASTELSEVMKETLLE